MEGTHPRKINVPLNHIYPIHTMENHITVKSNRHNFKRRQTQIRKKIKRKKSINGRENIEFRDSPEEITWQKVHYKTISSMNLNLIFWIKTEGIYLWTLREFPFALPIEGESDSAHPKGASHCCLGRVDVKHTWKPKLKDGENRHFYASTPFWSIHFVNMKFLIRCHSLEHKRNYLPCGMMC